MKSLKKKSTIKTKIISSISVVFILATIVLGYCYYEYLNAYPKGVNQPYIETVGFKIVKFEAGDGLKYYRTNGTFIDIPKNAFVDKKGNVVKGKLKFKVREYHTAKSILLSGIPMQIINDRNQFMQSSGMIELRVEKNGEELELNEGKEINIDLASIENPIDGSELFYLKDDKNWEVSGEFETVNNNRRDSALANLPKLPKKLLNPEVDSADFVFELTADYKKIPYLKPYKNVKWKIVKDENDSYPLWALRLNWDKVKLTEIDEDKQIFKIDLYWSKTTYKGISKKETCSFNAIPLLSGKRLAKAKKKYAKAKEEYDQLELLIEQEENRLIKQQAILNSFSVRKMGIYNVDYLNKQNIFAKVELKFDFQEDYSPEINKIMLIMVMEDINSIIKLNAFSWNDVPVVANTSIELLVMLPDNTLARVSPEKFSRKINDTTVSKHFTNTFYFETDRFEVEDYFSNKLDKVNAKPML